LTHIRRNVGVMLWFETTPFAPIPNSYHVERCFVGLQPLSADIQSPVGIDSGTIHASSNSPAKGRKGSRRSIECKKEILNFSTRIVGFHKNNRIAWHAHET